MNSITLYDQLSDTTIQLSWSDYCALLLSAENPSEFFTNKDKQQLNQIAIKLREVLN